MTITTRKAVWRRSTEDLPPPNKAVILSSMVVRLQGVGSHKRWQWVAAGMDPGDDGDEWEEEGALPPAHVIQCTSSYTWKPLSQNNNNANRKE